MFELRELEEKDVNTINEWRNREELISTLGATFRYINQDVEKEWYQNYLKNRNSTVRCAIVEKNEDKILGLISLTGINQFNQSATLHIMVGEKSNQGRGLGTFAIKKMMNHSFYNLNLRRIEFTVLSSHTRAISLYQKCGFKIEGKKEKAVFKNGEFHDMTMMALLKENFRSTDDE
ncbi:GNAT family protein [Vagococcus fluvialis]|uniref:GNAT family N-acetyltransferase n=1 Tax=Vagococcus fluvialis TaxID=2738 RepID=UPI00288CDF37|nr:GNAT family protein [Vagococcus fluvialis]MDT2782428.1 GNAT family protein [Vagococcus fluvialis]